MRTVLLTDEQGNAKGTAEISEAHSGKGLLHRAFSIFVFRNRRSELLLQKRSAGKRFGGLWTNTCCSHPQEGEQLAAAGEQRLSQELGFSTPLTEVASFVYWAKDLLGNIEHEYDTVLVGDVDEIDIVADPAEVSAWKWIDLRELRKDLEIHPEKYTPWFSQALSIALSARLAT